MREYDFSLWLEFEHWQGSEIEESENDFFNMVIHLRGGESYALNVWTYGFLETARGKTERLGRG
jgi:hypothetical protein